MIAMNAYELQEQWNRLRGLVKDRLGATYR